MDHLLVTICFIVLKHLKKKLSTKIQGPSKSLMCVAFVSLNLGIFQGNIVHCVLFLLLFHFRRYHSLRRICDENEFICILLLVFLSWNFVLTRTVSNFGTTRYPTESSRLDIASCSLSTCRYLHHIVFHRSSLRVHYRGCSVLQHQLIILFCNTICRIP